MPMLRLKLDDGLTSAGDESFLTSSCCTLHYFGTITPEEATYPNRTILQRGPPGHHVATRDKSMEPK